MNETYLETLSNITPAEPKPYLATRVKAVYAAKMNNDVIQSATTRWVSWAVAAMLVVNLFLWWNNSNTTDSIVDNENAIVSLDERSDLYNYFNNDK